MRTRRYRRGITLYNTLDGKLSLSSQDMPPGKLKVYPGGSLGLAEKMFLRSQSILGITIESKERRAFLQAVADLMDTHGRTLDPKCRTVIGWLTADLWYALIREDSGWRIVATKACRAYFDDQQAKQIIFRTRDEALDWAQSYANRYGHFR